MAKRIKKVTSSNIIDFEDAVAEAKKIVAETARLERDSGWRLGELADTIEAKYKDRTLARFAKEIGIASCTLARYRSVYRAWKDIEAPGPVSYSVMRELQNYDDRAAAVANDPQMTKAQARKLMGKSKAACKARGFEQDTKQWFRNFQVLANDIIREAAGLAYFSSENLRAMVEPELLPTLQQAATAMQEVVNRLVNEPELNEPELSVKAA